MILDVKILTDNLIIVLTTEEIINNGSCIICSQIIKIISFFIIIDLTDSNI